MDRQLLNVKGAVPRPFLAAMILIVNPSLVQKYDVRAYQIH